jgi:hypothetical protein
MREILPGVFHWTVDWPGVFPLESYWLFSEDGSVIVDPVDSAGLMALETAAEVRAVVVTSRWHERSARLLAIRTGAPLYVPAADREKFEDIDECETYVAGDMLPGDLLAISTAGGEWSAGEQALLSPLHGGTLLVADCLGTTAKWTPWDMVLGGHPHFHPHPGQTLSHLLDHKFENLLPGHGEPILGGAREALRELIESGVSTTPPAALD